MARPTKLTPQMVKDAREAAEMGMHNRLIADFCGITEQTLYNWQNVAENQTTGLHVEFFEAIRKGRVINAKRHLLVMNDADDVSASKWMLERRHGYKAEQTIEHTGGVVVESSPMERAAEALKVLKNS